MAHTLTDVFLQDPLRTSIGQLKNPTSTNPVGQRHWPYWMFLHGVVNGLGVYLVTQSLICMIGEVVLHSLIDYGKCCHWYNVHADQVLHFLCKVGWAITTT